MDVTWFRLPSDLLLASESPATAPDGHPPQQPPLVVLDTLATSISTPRNPRQRPPTHADCSWRPGRFDLDRVSTAFNVYLGDSSLGCSTFSFSGPKTNCICHCVLSSPPFLIDPSSIYLTQNHPPVSSVSNIIHLKFHPSQTFSHLNIKTSTPPAPAARLDEYSGLHSILLSILSYHSCQAQKKAKTKSSCAGTIDHIAATDGISDLQTRWLQ